MTRNDAPGRTAKSARGLNEIALAQGENLRAHQPGIAGPADQTEGEDHMMKSWAEHSGKSDGEKNAGKGEQHIDGAHDRLIEPSADISGEGPEGEADGQRNCHGGDADR